MITCQHRFAGGYAALLFCLCALVLTASTTSLADPLRLRSNAFAAAKPPVGLLTLEGVDRERGWISAEALVWVGANELESLESVELESLCPICLETRPQAMHARICGQGTWECADTCCRGCLFSHVRMAVQARQVQAAPLQLVNRIHGVE